MGYCTVEEENPASKDPGMGEEVLRRLCGVHRWRRRRRGSDETFVGRIKVLPEDFEVREIDLEGRVCALGDAAGAAFVCPTEIEEALAAVGAGNVGAPPAAPAEAPSAPAALLRVPMERDELLQTIPEGVEVLRRLEHQARWLWEGLSEDMLAEENFPHTASNVRVNAAEASDVAIADNATDGDGKELRGRVLAGLGRLFPQLCLASERQAQDRRQFVVRATPSLALLPVAHTNLIPTRTLLALYAFRAAGPFHSDAHRGCILADGLPKEQRRIVARALRHKKRKLPLQDILPPTTAGVASGNDRPGLRAKYNVGIGWHFSIETVQLTRAEVAANRAFWCAHAWTPGDAAVPTGAPEQGSDGTEIVTCMRLLWQTQSQARVPTARVRKRMQRQLQQQQHPPVAEAEAEAEPIEGEEGEEKDTKDANSRARKRVRLSCSSGGVTTSPDGGAGTASVPGYLSFVLCKDNVEHAVAMQHIHSAFHLPNVGMVHSAGTKDKRAVTYQWCTVPMHCLTTPRGLAEARARVHDLALADGARLTIGGFRAVHAPLRLGALQGNRFCLRIRDVHACSPATAAALPFPERLAARARRCASHGLVNFFGLQRFGIVSPTQAAEALAGAGGGDADSLAPTPRIGYELLRGRLRTAIHALISTSNHDSAEQAARLWTRFVVSSGFLRDESPELQQRVELLEADFRSSSSSNGGGGGGGGGAGSVAAVTLEQVIQALPRSQRTEIKLLRRLRDAGLDKCEEAWESVPFRLRYLYMHSFQSLLWNEAVSLRLQQHGLRPLCGDIVLHEAEEEPAQEDLHPFGESKYVRYISDEEVRAWEALEEEDPARQALLERVLVPQLGDEVILPRGDAQLPESPLSKQQQLQEEEEEEEEEEEKEDEAQCKWLRLTGSYRPLVVRPTDLHCETHEETEEEHFSVRLQFSLPAGCYATVLLWELMGTPCT